MKVRYKKMSAEEQINSIKSLWPDLPEEELKKVAGKVIAKSTDSYYYANNSTEKPIQN